MTSQAELLTLNYFFLIFRVIIVEMQHICNLIGLNGVHISDIFNCYRANIIFNVLKKCFSSL